MCKIIVPAHFFLGYFQEGSVIVKKKAFVPPPRFMNVDEARYVLLWGSYSISF